MMKKSKIKPLGLLTCAVILISGCSSSSNLRKFNDDISTEIPVEVAKKFEVKEVSEAKSPTLTPTHSKKKSSKAATKKEAAKMAAKPVPPMRRVDPTPFAVGEKLSYAIRYIGVTAAYFNLELLPLKLINERKTFHIRGVAKTVKFFELVYRVNDTIESFWDYDGLFSTRYTMDFDESKQTRKVVELYDYDKRKSYYWNRVDHVDKGFSETKEEFDIQLWSQDPISSLYYFRTLDLPKEAGRELRFPIILDGKPWEGVIKYTGKERIYANGKYYDANKFSFDTFHNGELKNKDNTIWVSDDDKKYILRIEAKVKIGSFAIALDKAE